MFAEDEARLLIGATDDPAVLSDLVQRRESGVPLEYLLGWAEFRGLRIAVEPGVFVPRQRTAFLAAQAIALARKAAAARLAAAAASGWQLRQDGSPVVVVELCCGAGAVAAAVAATVAGVELYAGDIDPVAVRCARRNLPDAYVFAGDLDEQLPAALRGRVDVLVANAPYVPSDEVAMMPPEARDYEPLTALDGGPDGLDIARRVLALAPGWLAPGGQVLIETSIRQAPVLAEAVRRNGLVPRVARSAALNATVVVGRAAKR